MGHQCGRCLSKDDGCSLSAMNCNNGAQQRSIFLPNRLVMPSLRESIRKSDAKVKASIFDNLAVRSHPIIVSSIIYS